MTTRLEIFLPMFDYYLFGHWLLFDYCILGNLYFIHFDNWIYI